MMLFVVVAAPERADEVDGVADALLPLAGDVHARVAVGHDQERRGRQLQVVLLGKIFGRSEKVCSIKC